ncbi:MAG: hypothetical protein HY040_00255 [Planctomycetes bacterium]|nr:hypothetical protein [Planctomycetota bacterium]
MARFEKMVERAKRDVRRSKKSYSGFRKTQKRYWEKLFGSSVEGLLERREVAQAYLRDPIPSRRIVALSILAHHWGPDATLASSSEDIVGKDPDHQVRAVALSILSICFAGARDSRIQTMLARIALKRSETNDVRFGAYLGLFQVSGMPIQSWPDPTTFQVETDIDNEFLNRLAGRATGKGDTHE